MKQFTELSLPIFTLFVHFHLTTYTATSKGRSTKAASANRTISQLASSGVAEPEPAYQLTEGRSVVAEQDLRVLTTPLFAAAAQMEIRGRSRVTLKSADGQTTLRLKPIPNAGKGQFDGNYQIIDLNGELAQALLGRREGQQIEFKGKAYQIVHVD